MVTFTAHERDGEAHDIAARAQGVLFVREGFAWMALLFPIIWLIYHRMWIVLAGFVAIVALVQLGVVTLGLSDAVAVVASVALSGVFALQANDLRCWSLGRRGYKLVALVSGRNRGECEKEFFTNWLAAQGARNDALSETTEAVKSAPAAAGKSDLAGDDVIGLFPEPGK